MGEASGFICAAIAVICFGSNFVPVKKYETGDGMFFQWVMCTCIWMAGFIVNIVQGFPPFQPLAMLGGFLWCTGNVMVVPIVKLIGLSLGLLLWGTANLIAGWSSGTFGLFGLEKETVPLPALNYVGFVLAVFSIGIYVFVKTEATPVKSQENIPLINDSYEPSTEQSSWVDRIPDAYRRPLGIVMSLISGIFYGVNFDPPTYLMDHGHSTNGLDYVFSHFTGIFITSTIYFLIYCMISKNRPSVYPECILPAFVSGALWSIADISWFVANSELDLVVAFPIVTTGPGLVASLWGIFVFKEIKGTRNIGILVAAFFTTIVAVTMITLSKVLK